MLRQPKRIALLAYLALATAGGYRRRDQIVGLFWPELDQAHARTQLRKQLHALRATIGPAALASRGEEEIRLDPAQFWCDAVAFMQNVESGQWSEALALYRGDLLEGLFPGGVGEGFQSWLEEQRKSLRQQASLAAWECSSREDLAGRRREALALARRAVELEPDDEEGVRRLIAVLDRYGDRAGALQVFSQWQSRLQDEFGAAPAPETRKLARKVQAPRVGESKETPAHLVPAPGVANASAERRVVRSLEPASLTLDAPPWYHRRSRLLVGVAGIGLLAAGVLIGSNVFGSTPEATVAVLAFRNLDDSSDTRVGNGLSEEVTAGLAQVPGITLRSTARVDADVSRSLGVAGMARRLGVAYLVDGSIRGGSPRLRVIARLVRARDGLEVWSRQYDVVDEDLLAAQEIIARSVVEDVRPWLSGSNGLARANQPRGTPEGR